MHLKRCVCEQLIQPVVSSSPCNHVWHTGLFLPQSQTRNPLDDSQITMSQTHSQAHTHILRISTEMHVVVKKSHPCPLPKQQRLMFASVAAVYFCVCVCLTCLSGRRWTAACGLCLCVLTVYPLHPPSPLSRLDSRRALLLLRQLSKQLTKWQTHTHTRTHSLQILLLLCLGLRGARCEVAHARACVPQTGVCVSFFFYILCVSVPLCL